MTNSKMTPRKRNNVRFVSSNYPEKHQDLCWGTKRSAWDSNEEAQSSPKPPSTTLSSSSSSSSMPSCPSRSLYQRILCQPKRRELFIYELPERLFIHNEEAISEQSSGDFFIFDENDEEEERMEKIHAPKIKSILKKSQYKISSQSKTLSGPQQLLTSKSKSKSKKNKNQNKNKNKNKNNVPITRKWSDISTDTDLTDSNHTASSSSSNSVNKMSTPLSRMHRDSVVDLRLLLVKRRSELKREDSYISSTSTLSI
jgi:hypothetical protein